MSDRQFMDCGDACRLIGMHDRQDPKCALTQAEAIPQKRKYRVGYYVEVEVEAIDRLDAYGIAHAITRWPEPQYRGDRRIPLKGRVNGIDCKGEIAAAMNITCRRLEDD